MLHFQLETEVNLKLQFNNFNPGLINVKLKELAVGGGNQKRVGINYFWSATAENSYTNPTLQEILRGIQCQPSHSIQFWLHTSISDTYVYFVENAHK
jgi:hypothetical protein